MCKCADVRMGECTDVQMCGCTNVRMCECANAARSFLPDSAISALSSALSAGTTLTTMFKKHAPGAQSDYVVAFVKFFVAFVVIFFCNAKNAKNREAAQRRSLTALVSHSLCTVVSPCRCGSGKSGSE